MDRRLNFNFTWTHGQHLPDFPEVLIPCVELDGLRQEAKGRLPGAMDDAPAAGGETAAV
jgi:hypothetical protein